MNWISNLNHMTGSSRIVLADRACRPYRILACVAEYFPADRVQVFSKDGWLSQEEARINWDRVASMNWLPDAQLTCSPTSDLPLLIDCGSTTTDIIAFGSSCPN